MADLSERAKAYAADQVAVRRSKSPVTTAASGPDPQAEADWLAGYAAAVEDAVRAVRNTNASKESGGEFVESAECEAAIRALAPS